VLRNINTIILETLDPLQVSYRPNGSTDDAISFALYTALSHLDKRNTYVRIFIEYCSAFNSIVHTKVINKLRTLGINTSLYNWILDLHRTLQQYAIPSGLRLVGLSFVFQQDNDPTHLQAV
jgi:hypothetical protein